MRMYLTILLLVVSLHPPPPLHVSTGDNANKYLQIVICKRVGLLMVHLFIGVKGNGHVRRMSGDSIRAFPLEII